MVFFCFLCTVGERSINPLTASCLEWFECCSTVFSFPETSDVSYHDHCKNVLLPAVRRITVLSSSEDEEIDIHKPFGRLSVINALV